MKHWRHFNSVRMLTGTVMVALVSACVLIIQPDEHMEPDGLAISLGSTVVVEIDGQMVTGSLTVRAGRGTDNVQVRFLDHHGDGIPFDPIEFYLEVTVADETVAWFEQHFPGEFGGHYHGTTVGQTTLIFSVMRGQVGSGQLHYASPSLPGIVTQ